MLPRMRTDDWKRFWTLDDAAETLGVTSTMYSKLWSLMISSEIPRYDEDKLSSANIIAKNIGSFNQLEIIELNTAYGREYGLKPVPIKRRVKR